MIECKYYIHHDGADFFITLSNGKTINVELFERDGCPDPRIDIRAENTLRINPVSSNVISIGVED